MQPEGNIWGTIATQLDGIEIIYDEPNVRSRILGKPEGTFLIYQGDDNTEENPYTIYAVKFSRRAGKNIVIPASIFYNSADKTFTVMGKGDYAPSYPTLRALIEGNDSFLQHHYTKTPPGYINF